MDKNLKKTVKTKGNFMSYELSKEKAIKKCEIAIDKVIDLQDAGYGCNDTSKAIDALRSLIYSIEKLE